MLYRDCKNGVEGSCSENTEQINIEGKHWTNHLRRCWGNTTGNRCLHQQSVHFEPEYETKYFKSANTNIQPSSPAIQKKEERKSNYTYLSLVLYGESHLRLLEDWGGNTHIYTYTHAYNFLLAIKFILEKSIYSVDSLFLSNLVYLVRKRGRCHCQKRVLIYVRIKLVYNQRHL